MRLGDCYVGSDGTIYLVVPARRVIQEQLRWWVDRVSAHMLSCHYDGPDTLADLHLISRREYGDAQFALVLP